MARALGSQTSAKLTTRYLGLASAPATDLSQYLIDLTVSGAGAYESASTRSQLTTERTVYVRWTPDAADAAVVIPMLRGEDAQTDYEWAFATTPGGSLCLHQNTVALWTSAAAYAIKDYSWSWSMRDNPDTTGASDAKLSEVVLYNHTDTVLVEIVQFTHVVATTNAAWTLAVGGWWNGAALTQVPTNVPSKARVSSAFHPHVEVLEDWVGARTAYVPGEDDGIAEPLGPIPVSSGMGDSAYFAGRHPYASTAAHSLAVIPRPWTPMVNAVLSDAEEMTLTPTPVAWTTKAPGSATYSQLINTLHWTAAPAGSTHAEVRVHVVSRVTGGAAVPVGVRLYAMNRLPGHPTIGQVVAPDLEYYFLEEILEVDHGLGGTGEWLELGAVRLPQFSATVTGWSGTVHLAVAYDVDPSNGSANDAAERLTIDAVHVRPTVRVGVGVFDP